MKLAADRLRRRCPACFGRMVRARKTFRWRCDGCFAEGIRFGPDLIVSVALAELGYFTDTPAERRERFLVKLNAERQVREVEQ